MPSVLQPQPARKPSIKIKPPPQSTTMVAPDTPTPAIAVEPIATTTKGEDEPPAKRPKLYFKEYIRVFVGPSNEEFAVHKNVIIDRSSFFKTAVAAKKSRSPYSVQPIVYLPEDDPEEFSDYLQVLYTATTDDYEAHEYERLFDLYILADKFGDMKSMNILMDAIIDAGDEHNTIPSLSDVSHAWERTKADSLLRRLLVDYYVHNANGDFLTSPDAEGLDLQEFFLEVLREYMRLKNDNPKETIKKALMDDIAAYPLCYGHRHDASCPECASE
ncbi:hypothetical protein LTR10_004529 [Elasticomyces elasticus]|nr:hypothetical protein LTR10_004529 [Elasticomyces elasticus]KAK4976848.1 hypothetical protein LTR42_002893 [Elasticomyces elasticus]